MTTEAPAQPKTFTLPELTALLEKISQNPPEAKAELAGHRDVFASAVLAELRGQPQTLSEAAQEPRKPNPKFLAALLGLDIDQFDIYLDSASELSANNLFTGRAYDAMELFALSRETAILAENLPVNLRQKAFRDVFENVLSGNERLEFTNKRIGEVLNAPFFEGVKKEFTTKLVETLKYADSYKISSFVNRFVNAGFISREEAPRIINSIVYHNRHFRKMLAIFTAGVAAAAGWAGAWGASSHSTDRQNEAAQQMRSLVVTGKPLPAPAMVHLIKPDGHLVTTEADPTPDRDGKKVYELVKAFRNGDSATFSQTELQAMERYIQAEAKAQHPFHQSLLSWKAGVPAIGASCIGLAVFGSIVVLSRQRVLTR
ncbi:MAG: hypothetical protein AB7U41_07275 [Dongiaceae bacterium]